MEIMHLSLVNSCFFLLPLEMDQTFNCREIMIIRETFLSDFSNFLGILDILFFVALAQICFIQCNGRQDVQNKDREGYEKGWLSKNSRARNMWKDPDLYVIPV